MLVYIAGILSAAPLIQHAKKFAWTSYNDRPDTGDGSDTGSVDNMFGYRTTDGSSMNWGPKDQPRDIWCVASSGRRPNIDGDGGMEEKDCVRLSLRHLRVGDPSGEVGCLDDQLCSDTMHSEHFCEYSISV